MRISDWSSDVCASDLHFGLHRRGDDRFMGDAELGFAVDDAVEHLGRRQRLQRGPQVRAAGDEAGKGLGEIAVGDGKGGGDGEGAEATADQVLRQPRHRVEAAEARSEEHTSELQSLMRISYAVFGLKK